MKVPLRSAENAPKISRLLRSNNDRHSRLKSREKESRGLMIRGWQRLMLALLSRKAEFERSNWQRRGRGPFSCAKGISTILLTHPSLYLAPQDQGPRHLAVQVLPRLPHILATLAPLHPLRRRRHPRSKYPRLQSRPGRQYQACQLEHPPQLQLRLP